MRLVKAPEDLNYDRTRLSGPVFCSDAISLVLIRPFGAGSFHQELFKHIYHRACVK